MIRIGTRDSALALWQANKVKSLLESLGEKSELIHIKSQGDLDTNTPLHSLGTVGVFTKALDNALLSEEIDIAVHSCKDLPTDAPKGIKYATYLERASYQDILVLKENADSIPTEKLNIATGSIRRRAQWKNRFPNHEIHNLRGNVNTRLQKLEDNDWFGAVFAKAGLERLEMDNIHYLNLDWMVPAPAQGVVAIVCRENDDENYNKLRKLNHKESEITSIAERQFLNVLEGGCSAPIGAHARIISNQIELEGILLNEEGTECFHEKITTDLEHADHIGKDLAEIILEKGGIRIIEELRKRQ